MVSLRDMLGGGTLSTFLGVPEADVADAADIMVFGADCATPYVSVGAYCSGGPAAIRAGSADYAGDLARVNFDLGGSVMPAGVTLLDGGDLVTDPDQPAANRAAIHRATTQILGNTAVPVLLGGDDSVPLAMLDAFGAHGPITILQIDAHIDWRDEVQGERLGLSSTMRRASEMAHVERIVQIGARGVGSAGMDALEAAKAWGALIVPAVDPDGVARAIEAIPAGANVVICLDVDALDPSIMPAVIAPTGGGLAHMDVVRLLLGVAAKAQLRGATMVEFMPENDRDGIGARTAAQLLTSIVGIIGRQRV
ncbi:MAG: arginase family protein [Sedimentitalea sp.]